MLRASCQEVLLAYDQVLAALRWVISPVVQLEDSQSPHAGTGIAKSHSQPALGCLLCSRLTGEQQVW